MSVQASEPFTVMSEGLTLHGSLTRAAKGDGRPRSGIVLCHEFPDQPIGADRWERSWRSLAERIADEAGWHVLVVGLRGVGRSEGDFSLRGWLADIKASATALAADPSVDSVWLCGSGTGGALAIVAAAEDPEIRGVAAMASPASFVRFRASTATMIAQARERGVLRDPKFPPDPARWARELIDIRPLDMVKRLSPRPLFLCHGVDDDLIPADDARQLAEAADGNVELHLLNRAGRRIRHDPRAVALLLGWLDRVAIRFGAMTPITGL